MTASEIVAVAAEIGRRLRQAGATSPDAIEEGYRALLPDLVRWCSERPIRFTEADAGYRKALAALFRRLLKRSEGDALEVRQHPETGLWNLFRPQAGRGRPNIRPRFRKWFRARWQADLAAERLDDEWRDKMAASLVRRLSGIPSAPGPLDHLVRRGGKYQRAGGHGYSGGDGRRPIRQ